MDQYDHFIAVDWAQTNMAVARLSRLSERITVFEGSSSVKDLKAYLGSLRGKVILTVEESTASQWLYTELRPNVENLIVCCPYRNRLLSEGAKSDRIDAKKLVQLLRGNLLRAVFHSGDELIRLRKLVSGYVDLVQAGVRLKNQRSALYRAKGRNIQEEESSEPLGDAYEEFILHGVEKRIQAYEDEKKLYENEFEKAAKQHASVRLLKSLPGISNILAAKIVSRVVDPRRFPSIGHFLSYCGLIRLERISGGRKYGSKKPRYCRIMKGAFKTAVAASVGQDRYDNAISDYYRYLIENKGYSERVAKHAVARRIATLAWGVLKSQKKFNPERRQLTRKPCEQSLK